MRELLDKVRNPSGHFQDAEPDDEGVSAAAGPVPSAGVLECHSGACRVRRARQ